MLKRHKETIMFSIAMFVLLCLCAFLAREPEKSEEKPDSKYEAFIVVAEKMITDDVKQIIMYDPTTKVMYTFISGSYEGISVLYNADGTLKLYSPNTEVY